MKQGIFNFISGAIAALGLTTVLAIANPVMANGSNTLSQGSTMISNGSIMVSEGASQVLADAASAAVGFTVDVIEVAGDVAKITMVTSGQASQASADVTISVASASLSSLAIVAGSAIEIMTVYAENSSEILGYLLLQEADVLLFVTPDKSALVLSTRTL